jgi:hypothetical protein
MDTDAAKELKELREQNGRLQGSLAEAELEKDALREVAEDTAIDVIKCRVWCSRRAGPGRPRGPDTFLAADDLGHRKAFAGTAIGAGTSAWISPRTGRFSAQRQFDYRRLIGVFDSYVGGGRVDLSVRGRGSGGPGPVVKGFVEMDAVWLAVPTVPVCWLSLDIPQNRGGMHYEE